LLLANDCGAKGGSPVDGPRATRIGSANAGRTLGQEAAGTGRAIRSDHESPFPQRERP